MPKIALAPVLLAAGCWSVFLAGCQEYSTHRDVGTAEPGDGEPAFEPATCDGGDCGTDGDLGTDSCCGADGEREDGDAGCVVPEPLPLDLALCLGACPALTDFELEGAARVLFVGKTDSTAGASRVILALEGQRQPLEIRARIPDGKEIPVSVGDVVRVAAALRQPWWEERGIQMFGADGYELYTHSDTSGSWKGAPTLCPPVPDRMGCGRVENPILNIEGVVLSQGRAGSYSMHDRTYRYWVGRLEQYHTLECGDVPEGWLELAYLNHALRSACRCQDDIDCARDEICEPYAQQCVPNPCLAMRCASGTVCDPFRGECVARPAAGCQRDADCGQDEICHPITGACLYDECRFIDCAPCSPLLSGCYGCLHDCDCGLGQCDRRARTCVDGCVSVKLGPSLAPENPQRFELYYACLEDALDDPGAVLRLVEPAAQCGLSPLPNTCPRSGQVACLIPLQRYPNQARITQECWARLCALSRNPLVQNLVGGYYLP